MSSEELLSVECYKSGLCKLIGQFDLEVIGYESQAEQVSRD